MAPKGPGEGEDGWGDILGADPVPPSPIVPPGTGEIDPPSFRAGGTGAGRATPREARRTIGPVPIWVVALLGVLAVATWVSMGARSTRRPVAPRASANQYTPAAEPGDQPAGSGVRLRGGLAAPPDPEPAPSLSTATGFGEREEAAPPARGEPAAGAEEPRKARQAPPGTDPASARAFERLPLSAYDRPPVGGVSQTGTHVDRITLGERYVQGRCEGEAQTFSIASVPRINVCFRIVHGRVDEDVTVLWQKDGGTVRRAKLSVPPRHAYSTRAYLVPRTEYAGAWQVRILSANDVELAARSFRMIE